jgi:hypothetical protein
VVDDDERVSAAEELSGWTVFATLEPVEGVVGLPLDQVGQGEPPSGVSAKTWSAMDHAAGFIRKQLEKEKRGQADVPNGEGGSMA